MEGLSTEVAAKYKLVDCTSDNMHLRYGRHVHWPSLTLAQADKIFASGEAHPHLQLIEEAPPEKPKKKKSSKEGDEDQQ